MSSPETRETTERRTTLVLEVELPEFYAEDLRPDDPNWQQWLELTGTDPADAEAVGQEILGNIGEVFCGLLIIEVSGEKDSEIIRTPVLMVGARAEDRPPSDDLRNPEHLAERVDEPVRELRIEAACESAARRVLERFARTLKSEYSGQIAQLAEQALQEARIAEDEAEKREEGRA
jgi:hypothetical protein